MGAFYSKCRLGAAKTFQFGNAPPGPQWNPRCGQQKAHPWPGALGYERRNYFTSKVFDPFSAPFT
jgi:hypothetical protein